MIRPQYFVQLEGRAVQPGLGLAGLTRSSYRLVARHSFCVQLAELFQIDDPFGRSGDPLHHATVSSQLGNIEAGVRYLECPAVQEDACNPRNFAHAGDVRIAEVRMSTSHEFFATNADMYDDGNGFRVEQVKARLIAEQPLHDMLIKLRAVTQIVVETIRETRSR